MIETSDISINTPRASFVAHGGRHMIGGQLEEAHCARGRGCSSPVSGNHDCMTGRVQAWVGGAAAGAATASLAAYLIVVGWDKADKIASVLALFVALAGLVISMLGVRREIRPPEPDPSGDGGRGRSHQYQSIVIRGGAGYASMNGNVSHYETGATGATLPPPPRSLSGDEGDGNR
ncbi:hypothetical protein CP976_38210 [Streptomyces coeruleorubidus]|uniref:Uncharacterized protein n=1 Tax=Streptomyces coeruleorubidus TaxID=116188 RepID=A0A5J6IEN4_STRC4|nr:hypothetical protein CP976_38210 [Streptomyces coeruleorubidus]